MSAGRRLYACPKCGYSTHGLTVDRCPECGLDLSDAAVQRFERQHANRQWRRLGFSFLTAAAFVFAAPVVIAAHLRSRSVLATLAITFMIACIGFQCVLIVKRHADLKRHRFDTPVARLGYHAFIVYASASLFAVHLVLAYLVAFVGFASMRLVFGV